ncbi:MAG: aminotransferase class III-fold pyridoxal phosphate-dependent enzyme [Sulfurimonas sp.]|nr:aminotransferase class III-fold pyridoxal phosphate-dependent enzyme [Sulfurimonas sp.]
MKVHYSLKSQETQQIKTKHREIRTSIPHPDTVEIMKDLRVYETDSMHDQLPILWDSAKDYQIFDGHGNCFIDLTSTIFVANIGHSHPKVIEAIQKSCTKPLLNNYYYPSKERRDFLKRLLEVTPSHLDKCILYTTGSETTEAAFKTMRQNGRKVDKQKIVIISFIGSFHGKTTGSQQLGGKEGGKEWIVNHDKDICHLPFPTEWYVKESGLQPDELFLRDIKNLEEMGLSIKNVAGIIMEPYQGWGALFYPQKYIDAMVQWAKQNKVLIAVDEVQAGFGRTGKLFGFEHYGMEPDLVCMGKAISSSIPLSAIIGRAEILNVDASMNSTHGGNPLACAASLASLNVLIDEKLVEQSFEKGKLLEKELLQWQKEFPEIISYISVRGLVAAVFFVKEQSEDLDIELVDALIYKAMLRGVNSVRTLSGTIKIGPPLSIPEDALVEAISVYKECLVELLEEKMLKLRHVGIVVRDLKKSVAFMKIYSALTLFKEMLEEGEYVEKLVGLKNASIHWAKLQAQDGTLIELLEYKDSEFRQKDNYAANRLGCSHIAISVADIDTIYEKLQQYNCKCNSKPLNSPDGKVKVMYAHDIDGTILEIVEEIA